MSAEPDPVAAYKAQLRLLIDRRPSGTRRKLATAFGSHPSFVSQITNPGLRVPLPAQHIPALFRICHFSPEERQAFLALYHRAHPAADEAPAERDELRIALPDLGSAARREEVAALISDFARRVIALAQSGADQPIAEDRLEEAHQRRR